MHNLLPDSRYSSRPLLALTSSHMLLEGDEAAPFFSSLFPLPRACGWRLLVGPSGYRPTSGGALVPRRSCRASSTTCTAGSEDNPLASPPKSPDGRAA